MQMRRSSERALAASAALSALLAAPVAGRAQQVQIQTAGAQSIVGVVTDSGGFPLDAEVYIVSLRRSGATGPDGRFRFTDIRPGQYQVGTRRVGYYPQLRRVTVTDTGAVVNFALIPIRYRLAPIVKSASRGGLTGVVGDTSYKTLGGVEVTSLATSRGRTTTDSMGRFYLDLKPGRHMVRVTKPGFGSRLMSVTIPKDSGRELVVQLTPASRRNAREEFNMKALRERLISRSPVYSTFWTREDMGKMDFKHFGSFVNAAAMQPVDESCFALIDGGPQQLPIWLLSPGEIEAMEVYVKSRTRGGIGAASAVKAPSRVVPRGPEGCASVIAWLRK